MKTIMFKVSLSKRMQKSSNRECVAKALEIFQQSYDVTPVPTKIINVELKKGATSSALELMKCLEWYCLPGAYITKYVQRTGIYAGRVFYSFFAPSRRKEVYFVSGEIFNEVTA